MINCPKCGTNNAADAVFCTSCGSSMKSDAASTIEHQAKRFAQNMEKMGKNLGDSMTKASQRIQKDSEDIGKRIEDRVDHASKSMEHWYDRTFGVFGPLLASFIFLIVFRLAIAILEIPSVRTSDTIQVAAVLVAYILPLFAVTLISNYTTYFARKSFKFKIFSPLFHAIAFVLFLYIISRILHDISVRFNIADMRTGAASLESSLPTIFVVVLLIGYVFLYMSLPREQGKAR